MEYYTTIRNIFLQHAVALSREGQDIRDDFLNDYIRLIKKECSVDVMDNYKNLFCEEDRNIIKQFVKAVKAVVVPQMMASLDAQLVGLQNVVNNHNVNNQNNVNDNNN